jgi:hypothetical protein
MNSENYINVCLTLNEELYKVREKLEEENKLKADDYFTTFSYQTDGYSDLITFNDFYIWSSEADVSVESEEELISILRKKVSNMAVIIAIWFQEYK